jgi:hypothetical protein
MKIGATRGERLCGSGCVNLVEFTNEIKRKNSGYATHIFLRDGKDKNIVISK